MVGNFKKQKLSDALSSKTVAEQTSRNNDSLKSTYDMSSLTSPSSMSDDETGGSTSEEDVESERDSEFEESGDEDSESDLDALKPKKKKNNDDGSTSFANAFNNIIGSKIKAHHRKDPILSRNKTTLKKLESDKLEAKAKRMFLAEKRNLRDKHRMRELLPLNEPERMNEYLIKEKKLRKVAQRGVVRLFNAVLSTQLRTNEEVSKEKLGQRKKDELMNEMSKEKFLDLVHAAGQS
ncbi:uncharacterized protein PRCAT00003630001 [Priceomyces carsonii]|uniref:uncharacterized protein n=1 Tax=Priceomyces carsonii TaxID=28549 RepID=UPI002ED9B2DA|nr:unnamed protein product [Priceomyces carsonii]